MGVGEGAHARISAHAQAGWRAHRHVSGAQQLVADVLPEIEQARSAANNAVDDEGVGREHALGGKVVVGRIVAKVEEESIQLAAWR
jgi:hypothetical protein